MAAQLLLYQHHQDKLHKHLDLKNTQIIQTLGSMQGVMNIVTFTLLKSGNGFKLSLSSMFEPVGQAFTTDQTKYAIIRCLNYV